MSLQKQDAASVKVAIPGVSGVGKSTLFEKIIRREKAKFIFVFDHKDGDLSRRFGVKPCFTPEQLMDALAATVEAGSGFVIFDPGHLFPGEPERGFAFFCSWVWTVGKLIKGKKVFCGDELDDLLEDRRPLCVILDQGRTFQFVCVFICQSMNALHNQVRKQFTEVFAFRQGDARGCVWLVEKGFVEAELLSLENGVWIYKNMNTGAMERGGSAFKPKNAGRDLSGL